MLSTGFMPPTTEIQLLQKKDDGTTQQSVLRLAKGFGKGRQGGFGEGRIGKSSEG
ncbi:hypothetical protein GOA89_32265 [Sinorhizobium meliloti]|nr:hypothetical protein [Sinorhizobium meliloti]MDW9850804.1 hypothetical protein [Sinorhizobium meliloti]MDX0147601.1 hypothetical protein [Sinorhizobium meliloti]MDX0153882.1 hypothetical protein [Sinorhizobium meliloti]MDX0172790.1 hypothetical protein [Sinorhizobium meliloti]